jgi:glucose-6-phosphate dehydrogenase assembly protein OpcA
METPITEQKEILLDLWEQINPAIRPLFLGWLADRVNLGDFVQWIRQRGKHEQEKRMG